MRTLLVCVALALSACTPTDPTPPTSSACAISESRDWSAWINVMPGVTPTLHVIGKVDVPHGGYTVTARAGPADRSATPVQQIIVETTERPGMHTQAVTTHDIHYQGPRIAQTYRAIRVMCGGRQLAEITEIIEAH